MKYPDHYWVCVWLAGLVLLTLNVNAHLREISSTLSKISLDMQSSRR